MSVRAIVRIATSTASRPRNFRAMASTAAQRHEQAALRVLVPIANGSEDIEAVTVIDVLRRAKLSVCVAAVGEDSLNVTLARGVHVVADAKISDLENDEWDLIAVPGGMPGSATLRDSSSLTTLLLRQRAQHKWIAAICAAPAVVLASHGLINASSRATAHGNFVEKLPCTEGRSERVAVDWASRTITSRGPGTAIEWGLTCVAAVLGEDAAAAVAGPLHIEPHQDAAWKAEWARARGPLA